MTIGSAACVNQTHLDVNLFRSRWATKVICCSLSFQKKKKKKEMEKCCLFTKAGNAWGILGACKFLSERQQMN